MNHNNIYIAKSSINQRYIQVLFNTLDEMTRALKVLQNTYPMCIYKIKDMKRKYFKLIVDTTEKIHSGAITKSAPKMMKRFLKILYSCFYISSRI